MSSEQPARRSSRDVILQTFTSIVAERGYDETSFSAVAQIVGVSKGTIVHHFGTKDKMLALSHLQYIERRLEEALDVVAHVEDPADQLAAIIYCLLRAHRDDRAPTVAFLREYMRFATDPGLEDVRTRRDQYSAVVTDILRRGVDAGAFHPLDADLTGLQVFGMCNYAWTWYRPGGRLGPEEIAAIFVQNLIGGLSTDPRLRADERFSPERLERLVAGATERDGSNHALTRPAPAR